MSFTGTLYETQKPAATLLCNRRRVLLAWEQGTGKTIIAAAAAEKLYEAGRATNTLVIAQSASAWQWKDKLDEFTTSDSVLVERLHNRDYHCPDLGYVVTSWNLFRRDFDVIASRKWDIVIADECQEFKNFKSKTGQLIKRLNNVVGPTYRWGLTGTAISNKLEELYSIFYWIDRGFLPPWPIFEESHIVKNELGLIHKYKNLKELNEYLQFRMDRKTHADQKGKMPRLMPPVVHKVEPTKKLLAAQDKLVSVLDTMAANISFDDEGNPRLAPSSKAAKAFHKVRENLCSDGKLQQAHRLVASILDENPTNRVVIFSTFKAPLYLLRDHFGCESVLFTGDQSTDQKRDAIRQFNGGGTRILLSSNAGAAGLDLNHANYVIHLDVPFSHSVVDQRNKRVTRLSSIHPTACSYFLVVEGSIEEYYYQVVLNKGKLASATLEGTADEVIIRPESLRSYLTED